jgi:RNA polymerase sigma-70 factor (ECF subfamily)
MKKAETQTMSAVAVELAAASGGSELLRRCQAGEPAALDELYRQHAGELYRHLHALLNDDEVEDALQQTFSQAFKNIRKFRGESKLATWLHGIAVRVALNIRRGRRRRQGTMDAYVTAASTEVSVAPSSEGVVRSRQLIAELERHLDDEPEAHRAAFVMYFVEQFDTSEIAAVLGGSPEATLLRIKRTRARVLEKMRREPAGGQPS